jgi:hypothetical protein
MKPLIETKVTELMTIRSKRIQVEADTILIELLKVAQIDISPEDIRPSDKLKALEMLGRHLKMFTDKIEVEETKPSILIKMDGTEVHFVPSKAKKDGTNG